MPVEPGVNILIVGAGKAGELLAANIRRDDSSPFNVVGFVDDDKSKIGKTISGAPVLGTSRDVARLVHQHELEELLFAIPSERGGAIRRIIDQTAGLRLAYKILPASPEVLMQDFKKDYLHHVRKIRPEDLLGGEIAKSDQQEVTAHTKGKTIMITGAAGSIGSELARQVTAHQAKKVILYDWWENGMFDLVNQLMEINPKGDYEFVIGDIKDRRKVDAIVGFFKPDTIFHAAAYKHVPLMEHNPSEAIKNNILGTKTIAEIAIKHKVKKFILVSSDKAVNPVNIMGATKRAAEKIVHILSQSQKDTIFCAVRFGNVINSNGSAIPVFEKQIQKGGPVTLTHKEMTRYFMTIPEAVHLILQSWIMGQNNDLFVLDMGEPVKIYDLAKLLIMLEGYEPEKDIEIKIIGLRPGEKMYEEVLVGEEETKATAVKKVFKTKNYMSFDKLAFLHNLDLLLESLEEEGVNISYLKDRLKVMISTYKPSS